MSLNFPSKFHFTPLKDFAFGNYIRDLTYKEKRLVGEHNTLLGNLISFYHTEQKAY